MSNSVWTDYIMSQFKGSWIQKTSLYKYDQIMALLVLPNCFTVAYHGIRIHTLIYM